MVRSVEHEIQTIKRVRTPAEPIGGQRGHGNTCVDRALSSPLTRSEPRLTTWPSVVELWDQNRGARTANATGSRLPPPSWSFSE